MGVFYTMEKIFFFNSQINFLMKKIVISLAKFDWTKFSNWPKSASVRLVDWQYFIIRQFNPLINSCAFYDGIVISINIVISRKKNKIQFNIIIMSTGYGSDSLMHGRTTGQVKFIMSSQNTVWNRKLALKEFKKKWQKLSFTVFKLFIEIIMWNCMYINSSLEKSSSENENNSYAR